MTSSTIATLRLAGEDDLLELDAESLQGLWTDEQYLRLSEGTNRLVELVDGRLERVPMPTDEHQVLVDWLLMAFRTVVLPNGGAIRFAPLRLRIRPGHFREPDLLLLRDAADRRRGNRYWAGADLVVEVISSDDPARDTVEKRAEYAAIGVTEYWLVDPRARTVTILRLTHGHYTEHGVFSRGEQATSALLAGFAVDVDALFAAWPATPDEPPALGV